MTRLSDNWPAVVTAGHCNDRALNPGWQDWTGRTAANEFFWQAEFVSCEPWDYQLHPTTGNHQRRLGFCAGVVVTQLQPC